MTWKVEVKVIEIRSGGVLVKIEDGRTGFIRRRELSWEQRIAFRPDIPGVGEQFKARIIQEGADGRQSLLSRRQLIDPWQDAKSKYVINDIVRGEVVNIRDFGVFVQLEPGIDAVIWQRHLPLLRDQFPQDVLAVGDQVQGVLLNINWSKRQMELNITRRLEQVSRAINDGEIPQITLFQEKLDEPGDDTAVQSPTSSSAINQTSSRRYHPPLPKLKRALIIDDNPDDWKHIAQALKQERELILDEVSDGEKALEKIGEEPNYDLIIVDLTLKDENGVDAARNLLEKQPDVSILFTSNDPLVDEKRLVIRGRKYPFALKEQDELIAWIDNLYGGYWEEIDRVDDAATVGEGSFIRQLGMAVFTRRPLTDVLSELLARLREETGVTHAMVLEVDVLKESAAIVAVDSLLDGELFTYGIDALYYSPVRSVVENKATDYRDCIQPDQLSALKNFFPLLDYQTYLGIPLTIPNMPTRYVLFLLDEYRPTMSNEVKEQAYLTTQFIKIALERGLLLDFMHRYEQRYTLGQLLGSLVHELTNKLDTLKSVDNLTTMLQKAEESPDIEDQRTWLRRGQETTIRIARAKQEIQELIKSYSRLASGNFEPVDVNEVVLKVARQLAKKAKEVRTRILFVKTPDLPPAQAVQPRLEQVITNVILNAIQQIDRKRYQMDKIAHERGDMPLCQQGVIRIQTRYRREAAYPVEIIVMDSGPGISAYRQEEIFLLDTSGREEGHGLGLYISRSLMETMGGRLHLVDSVTFLGSAFVIALSEFPTEGAG